jgi:hypothetical protein
MVNRHYEFLRLATAMLTALQVWEAVSDHHLIGGPPIAESGLVYSVAWFVAETFDPSSHLCRLCWISLRRRFSRPAPRRHHTWRTRPRQKNR